MSKSILIIGSGFAGVMAALAASRLRHEKGITPTDLSITVISPDPSMVIRPRLYEPKPESMSAPLTELFAVTEVVHFRGRAETIDSDARTVTVIREDGQSKKLHYDRLVLAAGSVGASPSISGLADFGFSVTQIEDAVMLDRHLHALAGRPSSPARDTVVVGGAGFTGLEAATEMPRRLREILGEGANIRVIIVDRAEHVAKALGSPPLSFIQARLTELRIETRLGASIEQLDIDGVTLSDGERIETSTLIWSGGMRASPLTRQLAAETDNIGRIIVEPDLRVPGAPEIFATGDTAKAATDADGHFAPMSCQHARRLGSFAGHNAAADLLGETTLAYDQPSYVVCLDLGPDTAIFTRGWDSQVELTGRQAKQVKTEINSVWIYPPAPERSAAYENALAARTVDF